MQRNNWLIGLSIISTLALGGACGDDETASTSTSTSTAVTSSSGVGGGATGTGGSGQGGGGGAGQGGDGGAGQGGAGGAGQGGAGGAGQGGAGGAGQGGGGQGGAGGAADPMINGCTKAAAETLVSPVKLTWGNPHARCVIVSVGSTVNWNGNFGTHPLYGGESPNQDAGSVITQASPTGQTTAVTFNAVGTFPYYCGNHPNTMKGVIYVE